MRMNSAYRLCRWGASVVLGVFGLVALFGCSFVQSVDPVYEEKTGIHLPGTFVWHDLLTSDVTAAKTFYGQLFHWTFTEGKSGRYSVARLAGKPVAGILDVPAYDGKRHAARWISALSVTDIDQAVNVVVANGGLIHKGPENIDDRGRVVLVSDPYGAQLALIHTRSGDPQDGGIRSGAWLWHELWTGTPDKAAVFYQQLAGYSQVDEMESYRILKSDEKWRAGIRELINPAYEKRWVPVIKADDVKALSEQVATLGGKVLIPPDHPDFSDSVALFADPSGALLIVQEWPGVVEQEGKE